MAENRLVGSLILRTFDIDSTSNTLSTITTGPPVVYNNLDNTFGSSFANGALVVWKNVNIRACMGELYNKHKRFNLKMTGAQLRANTATTIYDGSYLVYISGLPFSSGSTYNTRLGPTNQAVLGAVNFIIPQTTGVTISLLSGLVTFDKPLQDTLNISIEFKNSSPTSINGYREKTTTVLGHFSIICDIYGVDE